MIDTYFYTFISVLIVSCVAFVGLLTLSMRTDLLRSYVFVLVSLAIGALLGDAFIHLIPGAFATIENPLHVSLLVIAGILIFFSIEKILHWHHHGTDNELHTGTAPVGRLILLSDGFHNFIDGVIIGASYLVSVEVGIATTIAVIAHEIPQEIGDFGVLLYAGYTKMRALLLNFVSALFAIFGAAVSLVFGSSTETLVQFLVPVAAGGFIYIALADLIPQLPKSTRAGASIMQLGAVLAGVCIMVALLAFE